MSTIQPQAQPPHQSEPQIKWATVDQLLLRSNTMDPKQKFYHHFLDSVQALQELVNELPEVANVNGERQGAIDHILAGVTKLQNEVADAAEFTPSYDRKQYSETIKSLQDKLNETIARITPKTRFQFRKKSTHVDMGAPENDPRLSPGSLSRKLTEPIITGVTETGGKDEDTLGELPSKGKNYNEEMARPRESPLRKPSFSAAKNIGISNQSGLHIILPTSAAHATAAGSLTDLDRCIVDMSVPTAAGAPFPGLAIKDVAKSLIVAGRVSGPVHITGVSDSVLVVLARQVRIHECSNVDIYLHCASHPIIEDCSGMRFAPLPDTYITEADKAVENQWDQVDDFKWLKAGPSPNWTTLSEDERLDDETWKNVVPGQPGVSVEETLKKLGIPRS